jgi:glutathione S-transferase
MAASKDSVLWHIPVSNFNEKARWALDYKRVPHQRRDPPPGAHMPIALVLTRRSVTFPVLRIDGKTIGDSTSIIATLEERYPDPPLYPADAANRRRALELEDFFDENLGPDVRRMAFWEVLNNPESLRRAPPGFGAIVRRRYRIDEDSAAQSRLKVRAALALIEDALDGREHLVGDQFTVADLTAAALLGPLLAPPQWPYSDELARRPASLEERAAELRALPAGAWAMRIYERHRPPSAEIATSR